MTNQDIAEFIKAKDIKTRFVIMIQQSLRVEKNLDGWGCCKTINQRSRKYQRWDFTYERV